MKISVVIPAYNGEKWIAQCIENVLCQTHKNIEIIVVDDGSTDSTAAIASSYGSVKVISQTNQGLSVSRNAGAAAATGEYIHFLDVDDLLNREYYAAMVDAIGADTKVDMVFGGFENETLPDFSIRYKSRLLLVALEDKLSVTNVTQMAFAWRYLIRRAFLEQHRLTFIPGRLMEDMPFTLEAVAHAGTVVTAPGATYHYMKRGGSILSSRGKDHIRKLKEHYRLAREFRREFLQRHNLDTATGVWRKKQYKIFGIPLIYRVEYRNSKVRWFVGKLRVMQKKSVRP
jgi:CDP-glycerol glycerophosphotransferase